MLLQRLSVRKFTTAQKTNGLASLGRFGGVLIIRRYRTCGRSCITRSGMIPLDNVSIIRLRLYSTGFSRRRTLAPLTVDH